MFKCNLYKYLSQHLVNDVSCQLLVVLSEVHGAPHSPPLSIVTMVSVSTLTAMSTLRLSKWSTDVLCPGKVRRACLGPVATKLFSKYLQSLIGVQFCRLLARCKSLSSAGWIMGVLVEWCGFGSDGKACLGRQL